MGTFDRYVTLCSFQGSWPGVLHSGLFFGYINISSWTTLSIPRISTICFLNVDVSQVYNFNPFYILRSIKSAFYMYQRCLKFNKHDTKIIYLCLFLFLPIISSVQFSSVTQSCLTLCNPMNCSTSALPTHHQLLESTQTHIHWVGDAIQPFHPLSSPSPPALNLSQHQGLFKWVSFLHQVAKVLEFQLQHQSFQWTPRTDLL